MSETQTPSNEDFMRAFIDLQRKVADISNAAVGGSSLVPGDLIASAAATRSGCLLCDGSAVSRTDYGPLFAAIGTAFGVGDGSTTFNVPDYRGRTIAGPNGGTFVLGTATGAENITLTAAQSGMPAHTTGAGSSHTHAGGTTTGNSGHSHTQATGTAVVTTGAGASGFGAGALTIASSAGTNTENSHTHTTPTSGAEASHTHSVGAVAASSSHSNVQPTLPCNIFVKT